MPPLLLTTGDLLFFYNSLGTWNGTNGFQPGWVVLSGRDPRRVLQRAQVPPMPYTLPWERGDTPWECNVPLVTNLGGGHAIASPAHGDRFRLYFGGADAVVGTAVASVQSACTAE
eukprot:3624139-Prymnesium_polylepis.1